MSSCQHCPRERLLKQLSLDFFAKKGLIMMLLKVGGNDWWTVITVMQSVINKKYFPEWHVYFSCWKIVSEKVCVAVTHCYISILVLRRNNLPFLKCDYLPSSKSRFAVWTAGWTVQSDTNCRECQVCITPQQLMTLSLWIHLGESKVQVV